MTLQNPIISSVRITLRDTNLEHLIALLAILRDVQIYIDLDGTVLIPETETKIIEQLQARSDIEIDYGLPNRYRFATQASATGVTPELIALCHALYTGDEIEPMLSQALQMPDETSRLWRQRYREVMDGDKPRRT